MRQGGGYMLAKVNELNKNAIILLCVGIIAVTSIVLTLIITGIGGKGSAESIVEFQRFIEAEYGVKPKIHVELSDISESKSKTIIDGLEKDLNLGDILATEFEGQKLFNTKSQDATIMVNARYEE
jgi:hypothetical protein